MKNRWSWSLGKQLSFTIALLFAFSVAAENWELRGKVLNAPDLSLSSGTPAVFALECWDKDNQTVIVPEEVRYQFFGDGNYQSAEGVWKKSDAKELQFSDTLHQPGSLRLIAKVYRADGTPVLHKVNIWGQESEVPVTFDGGVFFDPDKIVVQTEEPADFDEFWVKQKQLLASEPIQVLEKKLICDPSEEVLAYMVKLSCPGSKRPVSGIMTIPRDAKEKSLPAKALFHGYGVHSANRYSAPDGKELIAFDVNAHGIDNWQAWEYYQDWSNGELKNYALAPEGNATPEASYFLGMLLRDLQALRYLKSLPEWDGKSLITSGHSQGGFQAISMAALDQDVTLCQANMPWLCNLKGTSEGYMPGFQPAWAEGLRYFDTSIMAKRVTCPVELNTGTGDYTCTPSSVMTAFHNFQGPVTFTIQQGVNHTDNRTDSIQSATLHK